MSNQREIKFRVWDSKNKQFVDDYNFCLYRGYPIEVLTTVGDGWCTKEMATTSPGTGEFIEDNWIIQQFTGLKDKNNKEIYEGDIVRYTIKYHDGQVEYECVDKVEYTSSGSFRPLPINDIVEEDTFYSTYWENYEIIGNIFETPELLNEKS
jgi:uncharacterized phage protein (TIGR01671 family)